MQHLGEKLAEFVFEELSTEQMSDAKRHLAECSECREKFEQFQHTHAMLKTSVDVDPPRRIVFQVERPASVWMWRWLAPMAAAAALVLAFLALAPIHVQWGEPQVAVVPSPTPAPVVVQQPADYEKIQAWLATEIEKRDAVQAKEIQRLRGEIAYLETLQRTVYRDTLDNAASIQLLAQKDE